MDELTPAIDKTIALADELLDETVAQFRDDAARLGDDVVVGHIVTHLEENWTTHALANALAFALRRLAQQPAGGGR